MVVFSARAGCTGDLTTASGEGMGDLMGERRFTDTGDDAIPASATSTSSSLSSSTSIGVSAGTATNDTTPAHEAHAANVTVSVERDATSARVASDTRQRTADVGTARHANAD
jgi:hypothetical protein